MHRGLSRNTADELQGTDLKNHLRVPFWYNLSRWRWAAYAVLCNVIMKEGEV